MNDLLATALRLARASPRKPRRMELRRAISTAYYALFHTAAEDAANMICGTGKDRPDGAWRDVYRSLDHATAKRACKRAAQLGFPGEAVHFADTFIRLQELRHLADYSPDFQPSRADALEAIGDAKAAIQALSACKRKDRIAFAVLLLLNNTRH